MIYDSHCHLDLMDNMTPIVQSIAKEDVGILSVGTKSIFKRSRNVW